jgi:predicted RNA-binding Zn-ribbon protein involved in translation (DUF1610 family)
MAARRALVRANGDKPWHCPACHQIPDRARAGVRVTRLYRCPDCRVSWWTGWSDWPLRQRIPTLARRRAAWLARTLVRRPR